MLKIKTEESQTEAAQSKENPITESARSDSVQHETVSTEVEVCIRAKVESFTGECTLTDLWYDKEKTEELIDSYMNYGHDSVNGVKRENVMAVLSNLKTGDKTAGMEPNTVYTNWNWIMIRDNEGSEWVVDDWGY